MNVYILTVSDIDRLTTILFAVKDKQAADILANCFVEARDGFIKVCNNITSAPTGYRWRECLEKIAQDNGFHAETFFPKNGENV